MYQLGSITFDGLRGFDTLKKSREAVYAELPLMQGKPRLQRTGTALQKIDIGIALHAAFTDVEADIAALDAYREDGEILPLISGDGTNFGNFVLVSIGETVLNTSPTGRTLTAEVTLSLSEHFDPNPAATIEAAAKTAAFAIGADKVVPVRLVRPPTTIMAVTSQNVTTGAAASAAAVGNIRQAEITPTQQASLFNRAKASMIQAKTAYENAKEAANSYANIAAKAPNLIATAQAALDNIGELETLLTSGDLTNALTVCDALEDSIGAIASATLPLNFTLIQRKPQ